MKKNHFRRNRSQNSFLKKVTFFSNFFFQPKCNCIHGLTLWKGNLLTFETKVNEFFYQTTLVTKEHKCRIKLKNFLRALNLLFKKTVIASQDKIHMSLSFPLLSVKYLSGILGNEMIFGFFWHNIAMTEEITINISRCAVNCDHNDLFTPTQ